MIFFQACNENSNLSYDKLDPTISSSESRAKTNSYQEAVDDLENELNRKYGKPGLEVKESAMRTVKMKLQIPNEKQADEGKKKELADLVLKKLKNTLSCSKFRKNNIAFIDLEVEEIKNKTLSLNAHISLGERDGVRDGNRGIARPYLTFNSSQNYDPWSSVAPLSYFVTNNILRTYDLQFGQSGYVFQNLNSKITEQIYELGSSNSYDITSDQTDFITDKYLWEFTCSHEGSSYVSCDPRWYIEVPPMYNLVKTSERNAVDNMNYNVMNAYKLGLESLLPTLSDGTRKVKSINLMKESIFAGCCDIQVHRGLVTFGNVVTVGPAEPAPDPEPCDCGGL
jgi:hypothetical protein